MKLKNLFLTTAIASAIVSAPVFAGPSAKFAATYTEKPSLSVSAFVTCDSTDGAVVTCHDNASDSGHTLALIKVPQDKELLVGVSAEIGLMTFTAVKGKNGGSGTSVADAEAAVYIHACPVGGGDCVMAKPGKIKLSKRIQSLSAKLGGVIKDCTFQAELEDDTTVDISEDCTVNDEEIALMLDTTAAHHFNFVLPNMAQGDYEIKAMFSTAASADVYLCDEYEVEGYTTLACDADSYVAGTAEAASVINKSMLTVQTVRATKDGIVDATTIN
jgi:hypothetical protein